MDLSITNSPSYSAKNNYPTNNTNNLPKSDVTFAGRKEGKEHGKANSRATAMALAALLAASPQFAKADETNSLAKVKPQVVELAGSNVVSTASGSNVVSTAPAKNVRILSETPIAPRIISYDKTSTNSVITAKNFNPDTIYILQASPDLRSKENWVSIEPFITSSDITLDEEKVFTVPEETSERNAFYRIINANYMYQ